MLRSKIYPTTLIIFLSLISYCAPGQGLDKLYIDPEANGQKLSEVLKQIENANNVDFIYNNQMVNAATVNGVTEKTRLSHYLEVMLNAFDLTTIEAQDNVFIITSTDIYKIFGIKKSNYLVLSPDDKSIVGRVKDAFTDELIPGAQISIPGSSKGTLTNLNGMFQITAPYQLFQLDISFVGYDQASYIIAYSPLGLSDNKLNIELFPESTELENIVITSERADNNVSGNLSGVETFTIETIKELPTFMGEVDPIRSLSTLPGISTVGEVSSGFNVRGGESGQNLIIQDGAVIYNPTHLFGFYSAFNPDMVNDMSLYKGGGPAKFGGRVSSVLDIKLKNGNTTAHTFSGGIGMVSSRLTAEGPIIKDRTSYIVGGRISYTNWLLKSTDRLELQNSAANFHDVNMKIFHKVNPSNYITVSGYYSHDDFKLQADSTISWGTKNLALKWDHTFNTTLSSTLNVANSNYTSSVTNVNKLSAFYYENTINNTRLTYDLELAPREGLTMNAGLEGNYNDINPGSIKPTSEISNTLAQRLEIQKSIEGALYAQVQWDITDKLSTTAGIRYSQFFRLGPGKIYSYDYQNLEGRYPSITDSTSYDNNSLIKSFFGVEPRISLRYLINPSFSIKASYYRGTQYLHQISNTTSVTPQDYWVSSGPYLKPNRSNQYAFGIFKNLNNNEFEISSEVYYKEIANTVDYIEGADITLNKALEAGMVQGEGVSYGAELQIKREKGFVNGWISYTYSRSLRKFQSTGNEGFSVINNGDFYASNYDQPHNLSMILNFELGERTTLSTNFSFSTGRPITIPISKFSYDSYLAVLNYSQRNEYRIPDYHRLDLSLTLKPLVKKNQRFQGEWVISVFNVYGRKNAYSIYFNKYGTANKLAILGTIFPSITYNFKFK